MPRLGMSHSLVIHCSNNGEQMQQHKPECAFMTVPTRLEHRHKVKVPLPKRQHKRKRKVCFYGTLYKYQIKQSTLLLVSS